MSLKDDILENVKSIPSMSSTVLRLGQIMRDPESGMDDIVNILKLDTGITTDVLKLVNSAAFGFNREISSVKEAVVHLGTKKLYQLAMSSSVQPVINKPLDGYFLDEGDMWRHSISVAITAESIAKKTKKGSGDSFTAGMLHDVGKIIISNYIQEKGETFDVEENSNSQFDFIERKILGIDHAELGAAVLEKWGFPKDLVQVTRYHHHPDNAEDFQVLVDQIHVADILCSSVFGCGRDGLQYELSSSAVERLGLTEAIMEALLVDILDETKKFDELLAKK